MYLTSTDGLCSAGHTPNRSYASYGTFLKPTPWENEQGLRALLTAAATQSAMRNLRMKPLFSYFSKHGPVFRVMVQIYKRGMKSKK